MAYEDVEVDIALRVAGEAGWHHHATSRVFEQQIDLKAGEGWLDVTVAGLRAIQAEGRFYISIWSRGREKLLFWWRIPVRFSDAIRSSGTVLYQTRYLTGVSASQLERASVQSPSMGDA